MFKKCFLALLLITSCKPNHSTELKDLVVTGEDNELVKYYSIVKAQSSDKHVLTVAECKADQKPSARCIQNINGVNYDLFNKHLDKILRERSLGRVWQMLPAMREILEEKGVPYPSDSNDLNMKQLMKELFPLAFDAALEDPATVWVGRMHTGTSFAGIATVLSIKMAQDGGSPMTVETASHRGAPCEEEGNRCGDGYSRFATTQLNVPTEKDGHFSTTGYDYTFYLNVHNKRLTAYSNIFDYVDLRYLIFNNSITIFRFGTNDGMRYGEDFNIGYDPRTEIKLVLPPRKLSTQN